MGGVDTYEREMTMFILGNLLKAIAEVISMIFTLLEWAILIRVILSWANADPYNNFVRIIGVISEPLLKPFRRLLPPWKLSGWDLSPFLAILALEFLKRFLIPTLYEFSAKLG